MSVFFVSELPQDTIGKEAIYVETPHIDLKYVLVKDDGTDTYKIYTEDFVLDCENDYIQRRFKESIYSQWHGKLASEAPLFREFLEIIKKKHDTNLAWVVESMKSMGTELPKPKKKRKRKKRIQNENPYQIVGMDLENSQVSIFEQPEPDSPNPLDGMQLTLPDDPAEAELVYNQLSVYLQSKEDAIDSSEFPELQAAAAKFYKIPANGDIVMVRAQGAYVIQSYTYNSEKELCAVATHIDTGVTILIPMSEMTLSITGTWVRESITLIENVQDFFGYFRGPAKLGSTAATILKYKSIIRIGRLITPAAMQVGRANMYFNSAMYAFMTLIPTAIFDTAWDYLAEKWGNNFEAVYVRDPALPLGQREYYSAVTGKSINVAATKNWLSQTYEDVKSALGKGYNFVTGTLPEKTKDLITATTNTVTSVFYGACILGGLGIAFKLAG